MIAKAEKWQMKPEQKGVACLDLKSGTEVVLTHFVDQNILYAQSLYSADRQRLFDIDQQINKYALKNGV